MKKKLIVFVFSSLFLVNNASAATIELFDWAFYVDGTTNEAVAGGSMPTIGTLADDGLGTLTWSTSALGPHTFLAFFDHDIDADGTGTNNEYGMAYRSPAEGQSWEIDEPGWFFGDIYDNLLAGALDNSNGVPDGSNDDVSWAMGWDFTLNQGQIADITLELGLTAPSSGFYLSHTDPDSPETFYFASTLLITDGSASTPVPEPGTLFLFGFGLVALLGMGRKKTNSDLNGMK